MQNSMDFELFECNLYITITIDNITSYTKYKWMTRNIPDLSFKDLFKIFEPLIGEQADIVVINNQYVYLYNVCEILYNVCEIKKSFNIAHYL